MSAELVHLTLTEQVAGVADGLFRARDLARAHLDRIQAHDDAIQSYVRVLGEDALAAAEAVDQNREAGRPLGPLAGAPLALKDIFVTRGVETCCGSRILRGWKPPYDGTHAARLRQAGAVILGKVTMDEFAMGSTNENTSFAVPRNPWSHDHVAGGSSGGSAAAVAARLAGASLGTDTGGSIRQPASLCNLVGLRPTYGRVTRHGMVAFASSLDQAGPLSRTARDAALVLRTIAGHDPRDATSLRDPVPDYVAACDRDVSNLRVGIDRATLEIDGLDPGVRRIFDDAVSSLRELGATIVDVTLPRFRHAVSTYYVLATAEAASNLARYDGVRYGRREARDSLGEMYRATREAGFGPEVKRRILLGTFVLRKDSYEAYYGRAQRVRTLIARDYEAAFQHCDVIASPMVPVPGFRRGENVDDPLTLYLSDVYTVGSSLAGLPGISIPAGFHDAGGARLPVGLQLVGPRLAEETLLALAAAHERITTWHQQQPPEVGT
jgi:aspartyl-tRNA(Asn)/glutamyl-tRNA(Gln) amidotransferase subunit A